jgi:electron transport complex protein RnfB
MPNDPSNIDRREFLRRTAQAVCAIALAGTAFRIFRTATEPAPGASPLPRHAWRIDPERCTHCGTCATACVRKPSAVKAVNDQKKCSFCVVCYGHISNQHIESERIDREGVRICPRNAVKRRNYSGGKDGYFIYSIDDQKCIGCAQCVKECNDKGTKSMFLLIRPDLCLGCNQCLIALKCPAQAVDFVEIHAANDLQAGCARKNQELNQAGEAQG